MKADMCQTESGQKRSKRSREIQNSSENQRKQYHTMNRNVFLFSGQGSQYYQMGVELYQNDPVFRRYMDALDSIPRSLINRSIVDILYNENNKKSGDFSRTLYTHPAIFMVEYSLAKSLIDSGITPDCLIGASLGEYLCLALARVLPAEEVLTLLIHHGRIVEETCEPGSMIGIIEEPELYEREPVIRENSSMVGINSDRHFVISGFKDKLMQIKAYLVENNKLFQELPISHGFHSPNIDPAFELCRKTIQPGRTKAPEIDIISCVTGKREAIFGESHLWEIARRPILFPQALKTLCQEFPSDYNIIDLGPAGTYAGFTRQNMVVGEKSRIYHIMTHFGNELRNLERIRGELKLNRVDRADQVDRTDQVENVRSTEKKRSGTKMRAFIFPGQGSQRRGMGKELFAQFKELVQIADDILGYSIESLCLEDPDKLLSNTRYTQPALFAVNGLTYLKAIERDGAKPDYLAGHSLGEYNALFAAGVIDFPTGLKLVKRRGELMAMARNGGMAAVLGMDEKRVRAIIEKSGVRQVDIANLNTPSQIVISGARGEIEALAPLFEGDRTTRYVLLNVSGAFHSRLMEEAGESFRQYLEGFDFSPPATPVISNFLARPYSPGDERRLLSLQMTHPVKWVESICYLWGKGVEDFVEIGPGNVLTRMVSAIRQEATPLHLDEPLYQCSSPCQSMSTPLDLETPVKVPSDLESPVKESTQSVVRRTPPLHQADSIEKRLLKISAASLGCREYKSDHNLKYAYATGGMVHGIASKEMVVKMGRAGMIGYFGSGALSADEIEKAIIHIQSQLDQGQSYGMNLLSGPREGQTVDLCLKHGVTRVEAAAYLQMTPALVKYKLRGLSRKPDGSICISNKIMGKLSRPEVALSFLTPAPPSIVRTLVEQGAVTEEQAMLAQHLPMADDICVEADSGGHTDMGVASALMPAMITLRNEMMEKYRYARKIRVGAAGGIGTPEAAAAAFILGADFILTGSINQCTVEAGTSDLVKDLLQDECAGYCLCSGRGYV